MDWTTMSGNIGSLPTELLIEVFVLCSDAEPYIPLTLGQVCWRWYEIVRSSPAIWQHIHLTDDTPLEQSLLWIARSAPLKFSAQLDMNDWDLALPKLAPLLGHIDRWSTLAIPSMGGAAVGQTIGGESLTYLSISFQSGAAKQPSVALWPYECKRQLLTLSLSRLPAPCLFTHTPLPFTSLTIIEIDHATLPMAPGPLLHFLSACPNIELLLFRGGLHVDADVYADAEIHSPPAHTLPVIHLPRLLTLDLRSTFSTRALLAHLHLPALKYLYLSHLNIDAQLPTPHNDLGDSDDPAHDFSQSPWSDHATGMGLRALILRSNPKLILLDMDFSDMRTKDFRWVFDSLPTLEKFCIIASDMSDTVINLLKPSALTLRLPRLRHLRLSSCQRLTGHAIVASLSARSKYTDAHAECASNITHGTVMNRFEAVTITDCEGFSHRHGELLRKDLGARLVLDS